MKRLAGQLAGELSRVGRGGRGGDQNRVRALRPAEPEETLENVVKVAAEDAAVGMQLVEDDPIELTQKRRPVLPVPEQAQMEHVGVRDHHPWRRALDPLAHRPRRVSVVDLAVEPFAGESRVTAERLSERIELGLLVLAEGLEWIEEETVPGLAQERSFEHGQLKDQ